jgi:hypothetical protein
VDRKYFNEHVRDYPRNVCVTSQVAALCGLDLEIFYHEHHEHHKVRHYDEVLGGKSWLHRPNGIASLLTFCPDTGLVKHKVMGKAYVVLKQGDIPLSRVQVWGLEEFIREALDLYNNTEDKQSAKRELLSWCFQYSQATWYPHSIYEPRHVLKTPRRLRQTLSNVSDQATCHHGYTHVHHKGHHDCCHSDDKMEDEATTHPVQNHDDKMEDVHNHVLSHPDAALEYPHEQHIHKDPSVVVHAPCQRNYLCHG